MTSCERARIHAAVDDLLRTRRQPLHARASAAYARELLYMAADRSGSGDGVYGHVARLEAEMFGQVA